MDALGPCLCFVLDFTYKNRSICYFNHYDNDIDMEDPYAPSVHLLEDYFVMICKDLRNLLGTKSLAPVSTAGSGITNIRLVVVGGDVDDRRSVKDAFLLLIRRK